MKPQFSKERKEVSTSPAWESSEQHLPPYQVGAPGGVKSLSPPTLALWFLPSLPSTRWHHFSQCIEITISFLPSFFAWLAYILMERTYFWKVTKIGLRHLSWVWTEGSCWATQSKRCIPTLGISKMVLKLKRKVCRWHWVTKSRLGESDLS